MWQVLFGQPATSVGSKSWSPHSHGHCKSGVKLVSNQFHTQIDTLGVCYVHKAHSALWVHDVIVVIDDILAIQPTQRS